jgi:hypothetical protein
MFAESFLVAFFLAALLAAFLGPANLSPFITISLAMCCIHSVRATVAGTAPARAV